MPLLFEVEVDLVDGLLRLEGAQHVGRELHFNLVGEIRIGNFHTCEWLIEKDRSEIFATWRLTCMRSRQPESLVHTSG